MPSFSPRSKTRLITCDPRIQRVFNEVIKTWDCTLLEGHRGQERQDELFRQGKSKVLWPNGDHNAVPSRAIDAVPYPIDWHNWDRFYAFAGFVLGVAQVLCVKLGSGLDWDGDRNFKDQSFHDAPHFFLRD